MPARIAATSDPLYGIAFFSRNPKRRAPPSHVLRVRASRSRHVTQKISLDAFFGKAGSLFAHLLFLQVKRADKTELRDIARANVVKF